MPSSKKPGMPGFLLSDAHLLRTGIQRLWRRHRHRFHAVDVFLDLVEQRAWLGRYFGLRLLAVLRRRSDIGAVVLAEQGFITTHAGHEVAGQADKLVIAIEDDADALLLAFTAAWLKAVEIIPAIGMESVGQQGVTHDKPYLPSGHSGA